MEIKEARKIAGYTRKQVEKEFLVPARTLQNWEKEYRSPPPPYVEKYLIEKLLQVKKQVRIRLREKSVSLEIPDENQEWKTCEVFPVIKALEDNMMPAEFINTLKKYSEEGYKITWYED